jgi:hypothetical protein
MFHCLFTSKKIFFCIKYLYIYIYIYIYIYSFHGVKFINVSFQIFMVTPFVIMVFMVHFFKVTCDACTTTIFLGYKSIFMVVNAIFCGDMLPQKFEIHKSEGIIRM